MGSPHYGRLTLDGKAISGAADIEIHSLLWSDDRKQLAAQELVSWSTEPTTRVLVFDTEQRKRIAASPSRAGIGQPLRFEPGTLVYRHWNQHAGEQEFRLKIEGD
jgi:hypothetical protein